MPQFKFVTSATPDGYVCSTCGAIGCKLWRDYGHTSPLMCAVCAEVDAASTHEPGWLSSFALDEGDQIGWFIPAVPCDGIKSFWSYGAVPAVGCDWWYALPTLGAVPDGCRKPTITERMQAAGLAL